MLPAFTFGIKTNCTYCGDMATVLDHVIAVSYQKYETRSSKEPKAGPRTHACADCNRALGNRYFSTFEERLSWASFRLKLKCKPINWAEREIAALDHSLRQYVRSHRNKRLAMQQRADWLHGREQSLAIDSLTYEPCLQSWEPKFHRELGAYFLPTILRLKERWQ